jgi:hypothetical protein
MALDLGGGALVTSGRQSQGPTRANVADSRHDGVNVDPEVAVEITYRSRLTEMLDPERHCAVPGDGSEPGKRCGMTVDDGYQRAMGGQCCEQPLSKALRPGVPPGTGPTGRCPACIQAVWRPLSAGTSLNPSRRQFWSNAPQGGHARCVEAFKGWPENLVTAKLSTQL